MKQLAARKKSAEIIVNEMKEKREEAEKKAKEQVEEQKKVRHTVFNCR